MLATEEAGLDRYVGARETSSRSKKDAEEETPMRQADILASLSSEAELTSVPVPVRQGGWSHRGAGIFE